jgi:hypothetical protein
MAMDIRPEVKPGIGLELPPNANKEEKKETSKSSSKGVKSIVTIIVVIIVLAAVGFLVNQYTSINLFGGGGKVLGVSTYNTSSYHAVFLSNGQVYFGKIVDTSSNFTMLEDIYYLQVSEPLQQAPAADAGTEPQLTLVKLGNELHGPKDFMKVNNTQVIFIEELKNDGKVAQAIAQYKIDNTTTITE